jgi:lia operon protein LiaF
MRNRGQLVLGIGLVLLGIIFLLSTVFHINLWPLCWSVGLILLGVWLVLRPRLAGPNSGTEVSLLGDMRRRGIWTVRNEELWLGVGDVDLDLTEAIIPPGETTLRFFTFVSDIDIYVPKTAGVSIHAMGFVTDADLLGRDYETFFAPVEVASEGYATAECRVRIELTGFVANLKVRRI